MTACAYSSPYIYVVPNMHPQPSSTDLLLTVAEPTRLRILNCLAAAPLFVSDLQAVLGLPQPTVSRHLQVLRRAEVVRDTPIAQFVLYRLRRDLGAQGRLLSAILDAVVHDDDTMRAERDRAAERSRSHTRTRVERPS
jgi:ArsR family transcriptional regulator, arsenate/arsenite/antimonite-responsive transcriptional repressor